MTDNVMHIPVLTEAVGLWELDVKDASGRCWTIVQQDKGCGNNENCCWILPEGIKITASAVSAKYGTEWHIAAENNSELTITAIHYPVFHGITAKADDYFVLPWQTGAKINDPVNELMADEIIPSEWIGEVRRSHCFAAEYPGLNSMQFMVYNNGKSSFYYGIHDPDAAYKTFGLYRDKTAGNACLSSCHFPPAAIVPGKSFSLPYFVCTAVFEKDWLEAAHFYRKWALRQKWCSCGTVSKRHDIPSWVKDIGVWYWNWSYAQEKGDPETIYPILAMINEKTGAPCALHWYGWHDQYHDTDYPEYKVSEAAAERLQKALELYHNSNIRVFPYLNGRLWNIDTESWHKENAAQYACLRGYPRHGENFQYYIEPYMNRPFAAMCPYTEFWQEKVCRNVEKVLEYGMDGAYIDQITSSFPVACHNPEHGHEIYGDYWVRGYCRMLEKIREMRDRVNPDAVLTSESVVETYINSFDMFLGYIAAMPMTVLGNKTETIPLFSAVYHDLIPLYGTGTVAEAPDFYYGQALDIQNGIMPSLHGIFTADKDDPEMMEKLDWICRWAKIYQHIAEYMTDAVLVELPSLSEAVTMVSRYGKPVEVSAVCAALWDCGNKRILTAVNHSSVSTLINLPETVGRYMVTEEGFNAVQSNVSQYILEPHTVCVWTD